MKKTLLSLSFLTLATTSFAQDIPQKYLDVFGDMAIAVTGSQLCDDVSLNDANFNQEGVSLRADAKADGMSDDEVEKMMTSLEGNPDLLTNSMMKFGEAHSVSPTDIPGFCAAIKQEQASGTRLGKMTQ